MGIDAIKSGVPSNLDLIREAGSTSDCHRQVELADHPSHLVRRALVQNNGLCPEAAKILGDDIEELRRNTGNQAGEILPG